MKGFKAIFTATLLEIACDPLALLITLSALALSTFAGALHYHQFGEPSRMAREAGVSALLIPGLAFAVFSSIRAIRREMESGTVQMALAHSVSRAGFLFAKMTGVLAAFSIFFATVWANSLVAVKGSELGALAANGDIARVWGPSLALGVAAIAVPPVLGAILNRFASLRFVRTATFLALFISLAGVFYKFDSALALRQLGLSLAVFPPVIFFMALAGAAAVRLKGNSASALSFAVMAFALPVLGAHYLPDALENGGSVPLGYLALAFAAALPLAAAAFLAGVGLFCERDLT